MGQPIQRTHLTIRPATRADVPAIVRLLADDPLGQTHERYEEPLPQAYYAAFAAIDGDPRNELVVVEAVKGAPRGGTRSGAVSRRSTTRNGAHSPSRCLCGNAMIASWGSWCRTELLRAMMTCAPSCRLACRIT